MNNDYPEVVDPCNTCKVFTTFHPKMCNKNKCKYAAARAEVRRLREQLKGSKESFEAASMAAGWSGFRSDR